jgi:predicted RNA-binding protein with PIN domain
VTFLIDGYNLMHAVGLARREMPAGTLHQARRRFLDWLADAADRRAATLRVIFDALEAARQSPDSDHRGVVVRFASGRTADDEIEALLAEERKPSMVTVVSNDSRLREAARRRGAPFRSCEEFVDWTLETRSRGTPPSPPREVDKPEPAPTEAERAAWLAAFSQPPSKRRRR